jgi:predicted AAA+ superfamily ATPase
MQNENMIKRILTPPDDQSFFLFGPRGTGKTTWVQTQYPKAVYIDLLNSATRDRLLTHPNLLGDMIPTDTKEWIIIDEIQFVPALLHEVHRLIHSKQYKFVLTGSSARSLRRKGVNLLGGRAATCSFHPLSALELGSHFDLLRSLQYGHLPKAYLGKTPQKYLKGYVLNYLKNEVKQEGLTRNLGAFSRFMEVASFSQGGVLNYAEISREAAIERTVVTNYFDILEDLLVGIRLPVFTKKAKRRMVMHHKFYYFDVGVYRTIRPIGPLDMPQSVAGAAMETLILQELRAVNDALELGYDIYYWRTSNMKEVDFVLYGEKGIIAIESKSSSRVNSGMFSGLKAFKADYPMAKCYLVYGGEEREYHDGMDLIGVREFLKTLPQFLKGKTM